MTQSPNSVKMLASFERNIFVPLVGDNTNPDNVHRLLKQRSARISVESIRALMDGQESKLRDFEVVTVMRSDDEPAVAEVSKPALKMPANQPANRVSKGPHLSRARGRNYAPQDEVKPIKRGTVYAKMMEMLLKGATAQQLKDSTTNATTGGVSDVLSWQIKDKGYGLRLDEATGMYYLILPKGQKEIKYRD